MPGWLPKAEAVSVTAAEREGREDGLMSSLLFGWLWVAFAGHGGGIPERPSDRKKARGSERWYQKLVACCSVSLNRKKATKATPKSAVPYPSSSTNHHISSSWQLAVSNSNSRCFRQQSTCDPLPLSLDPLPTAHPTLALDFPPKILFVTRPSSTSRSAEHVLSVIIPEDPLKDQAEASINSIIIGLLSTAIITTGVDGRQQCTVVETSSP
jgi:hypothetical protein